MGFNVAFRPHPPSPGHTPGEEPPTRDDDYFSLIVKSCSLLDEVPGSEFVFSGFGRDRWNMDVAYDMSTFVEAVPDLVQRIEHERPAEVDLYSQGVECQLEFRPLHDDVEVRCRSFTEWSPEPGIELVSRSDLLEMMRRLQRDFARGLAMIDPGLAAIPPLDAWLQSGRARP